MARCRSCKVQRVLLIALSFLLLLSVARAPAAPPTPTSGPEGQTFSFPWPPEWIAQGKYQKMVLRGVTGFNPGQWDVQACGTLPDCLMPAGPLFNGLVYHNPINPDEIVCDLYSAGPSVRMARPTPSGCGRRSGMMGNRSLPRTLNSPWTGSSSPAPSESELGCYARSTNPRAPRW